MADLHYTYVINWPDAIAAGETVRKSVKIDGDSKFRIEAFLFVSTLAAAVSNAVAGTPLPRVSSDLTSGNTMPSLAMIDLEFSTAERQLMSGPLSADLVTGYGTDPGYPLTQIVLPAGRTFECALTNNSAVSVKAKLGLRGAKLK